MLGSYLYHQLKKFVAKPDSDSNFAPQRYQTKKLSNSDTQITVSVYSSRRFYPFTFSMESRKRPHSLEDELTIHKKPKFSSINGTPHVNGVVNDADEPKDTDNLEVIMMFYHSSCIPCTQDLRV